MRRRDRLLSLVLSPMAGRSWWVIVMMAAVAAFLVASLVSSQVRGAGIHPDFREGYHPGAVSLQRGSGYVDQSGHFITAWPPGWSLFISPWVVPDARQSAQRLRIVSGLMAAVWTVVLALLARLILPGVSILTVLVLGVFWPPMWGLGDPMGSDMLFAMLSTAALCLLVYLYRLRYPALSRTVVLVVSAWLLIAAASLTRTIGIAVAAALFLGVAVGFRRWSHRRRVAVLLLGSAVFVVGLSPWLRAYREHTGHYGFTSNGFVSVRQGLARNQGLPLGRELSERSAAWRTYGDMLADVRDLSLADPGGVLRLMASKLVGPWYATTSQRYDRYLLAVQLPGLVLFLAASCRTLWRFKRIPGEVILIHGYVVALWFTAALVEPLLRYLTPGLPFVVMAVLWHVVDAEIVRNPGGHALEMPRSDGLPPRRSASS